MAQFYNNVNKNYEGFIKEKQWQQINTFKQYISKNNSIKKYKASHYIKV